MKYTELNRISPEGNIFSINNKIKLKLHNRKTNVVNGIL